MRSTGFMSKIAGFVMIILNCFRKYGITFMKFFIPISMVIIGVVFYDEFSNINISMAAVGML